jgi:hypothetical protein
MASLSAYYPLPVVAGTTAGTYAEGDDSRIVGALPSSTAGGGSVLASGSTTSRTLSQRFGEVFHVDDYGAVGDGKYIPTTSITSGSATLTAGYAAFSSLDVGKTIIVDGAGASGANLETTILSFTSSTQIVLAVNASTTVTNKPTSLGTDDRAAIQAAVNAAVAANGGTINFTGGKTYFINSVTNRTDPVGFPFPTFGFAVGSGNTTSGFGSPTLRLMFQGNNATIVMTKGPPTNGSSICYICCRFSYIGFENLKFIRSRYYITGVGAQASGVSFWAYDDTNTHDQVYFNNCQFINCHHSIAFHAVRRVNFLAVRGKLKKVDITNCTFDHPYGAGRPANYDTSNGWSGALVINGDTWIDVANFENCYADGMNGGVLPIENFDTMHGFLFPMPLKTNVRNCYFKHMSVECIKASDGENAQTGITLNGPFTQPAVGQTMARTVVSNGENLQTMTVGGIYSFVDDNYFAGRIGIYRLESKAGGGDYTFLAGDVLTFTRLSSDLYDMPSARDLATAAGNVIPIDMATLDRMSLQVSGCVFDASEKITYQLASPATGGNPWMSPSILCDYKLIVTNNIFIGGVYNVYCGSTAANHKQTVITGNTFYSYSINNLQSQGVGQFIEMRKSNVIISNNSFVIKESRAATAAIGVGGHEIVISNNLIIVQQPSSFGADGVDQSEPIFILERNGGPWRVIGQNNCLRDMGHYVFANHTPHVGSFYGNILSTIGRNDGGTVSTFRTGKPFRSANGQTWHINITNDGEVEVFQ